MNLFQTLALSVLALWFALAARGLFNRRGSRKLRTVWLLVLLAAAVAVAAPGLTGQVAQSVGIGRGVDLMLYIFVLFSLFGFFIVSTKLRRLNRMITLITRELALRDATLNRTSEHGL